MTETSIGGNANGLLLPDGRLIRPSLSEDKYGVQRVGGLMTRSEWRQLELILRAQYFLFRNDGGQYGERLICKAQNPDGTWRGCGLVHSHITYMCRELPFRGGDGLEQGLYLSFRVATDDARKNSLLTAISKLPDLANGHPLTARDFAPKESGEDWLGVLLSLPEPITRKEAEKFAARINDQRPPMPFSIGPP